MAYFPILKAPKDYLTKELQEEHGRWLAEVVETDRLLKACETAPREAREAFADDPAGFDLAGAFDRLRDNERTKALLSQRLLRLEAALPALAQKTAAAYQVEGERAAAALEARMADIAQTDTPPSRNPKIRTKPTRLN